MANFSRSVAWWPFNLINQYSDLNFKLINADVRSKAAEVESEAARQLATWEAAADQLGGEAGMELLTARSNAFAEAKVSQWWDYAFSLFAKYGRYAVTHNESANGEETVRYPEWWAMSPEVGFATWAPGGPFHGILMETPMSALAVTAPLLVHSRIAVFGLLALTAMMAAAALGGFLVGLRRGLKANCCEQDVYVAQP